MWSSLIDLEIYEYLWIDLNENYKAVNAAKRDTFCWNIITSITAVLHRIRITTEHTSTVVLRTKLIQC